MTTSKPSKEIHVIDVPDVANFSAKFVYNYHVADEGSDSTAGVTENLLTKSGEFFDSKIIDYLGSSRVPRYIQLNWSTVSYRDRIYGQSSVYHDAPLPKNYIKNNITKVLSEEHFTSENYTSVNINDQSIDKKMFQYISSSAVLLNSKNEDALTQRGLALKTNEITSNEVDFQFLSKYLVQPSEDGAFFFQKNAQQIRNQTIENLKNFNMQVQFNNRVMHNLIKRAAVFPESTFASSYLPLYELSKKIQGQAQSRGLKELRADDYKTIAPDHVSVSSTLNGDASLTTRARIVGYIIDKHEILPNGNTVQLESIVVENQSSSVTIDLKIKYYSKYHYTIRSVAEFVIPSIIENTGELAVATFLISSKPSVPKTVECEEVVPPPPPSDVKFVWNYETEKLFIHWSFPPNSQRDIKQFQIFRRRKVTEPFQLVKQIYFDDSTVQAKYNETPDSRLVEIVNTPKLFWIDDEFTKDSSYIYALGTIDAHGIVSCYGPQTIITFDRYKNKLKAKRISPSGAPKPYPNSFLKADVFKDSLVESAKYTMKVAFQPEHLRVVDKNQNDLGLIKTDADNASYKFLIMNTDLSVANTVEIVIKEKRNSKITNEPASSLTIPDYGNKVAKNSS